VIEDALDDGGVLDAGDHPQAAGVANVGADDFECN
jgi:hypothetical protein